MNKISLEMKIKNENCIYTEAFVDNNKSKEGVSIESFSLSGQPLRELARENIKDCLQSLEYHYAIKEKEIACQKLLSVIDHMEFSEGDKFTIYAITN